MRSALLLVALVAACDASPVPVTNCTPGVQTPCACPGGSSGAQRCNDTGSAFEACMCRDAEPPVDVTTDAVAVADAPADGQQLDATSDAGGDVIRPDLDGRCPGMLYACRNRCIDVRSDLNNCGRCGNVCGTSAEAMCVPDGISGRCVPLVADAGTSD